MKKSVRFAALCLSLLMLLCAVSFAEEATVADDSVLAVYKTTEIKKSMIDTVIASMASNGYLETATDYKGAVDLYIDDMIITDKMEELGCGDFTEEELAEIQTNAQAAYDAELDSYVDYYLTEDTEEARATLREQGAAYLTLYGYTLDVYVDDAKLSAKQAKLLKLMEEAYPLEGEALTTAVADYVAGYIAYYTAQFDQTYGDPYMYELYSTYYDMSFYYPAGYRSVQQILLVPDEALLTAYTTLQAQYEEQQSADTTDAAATTETTAEPAATEVPAEPVTEEKIAAAKQAILDSLQDKIDDIYARIANGEDFVTLIGEYNQDSGMNDEATRNKGYAVHKDSIKYDPAFIEAAFSSKIEKIGDVGEPVVGTYGVYIVKYMSDIEAGMQLTDEERADLNESAAAYLKQQNGYTESMIVWRAEANATYNTEAIEKATADAVAAEAAAAESTTTTTDGSDVTIE